MNFFDHKDLGNHLLQLCPKVVKHPVYIYIYIYIYIYTLSSRDVDVWSKLRRVFSHLQLESEMIMTYIPRYFIYVKRGHKCEYFGPSCPNASYWRVFVHLQQNAHSVSNTRYVECDNLVPLNPLNTVVIKVCHLL